MEESILNTIKKMLGIDPSYTVFDVDIIVGINSALMALGQFGVGPGTGYKITGTDETWASLFGERIDIENAKTYVYIKTKELFDPPSNSSMIESMNKVADEIAWRIMVEVENGRLSGAL